MTDINILLEANIALFKISNDTKISLLTDQDLPPFKIDQNAFSKLLRNALSIFSNADIIDISLKLLIGRHVIIDGKRESIVQLYVESPNHNIHSDDIINKLGIRCHTKIIATDNSIKLEVPAIK